MKQGYILCVGMGILIAGCASTGPSKESLVARASASQSSESVGTIALNSKIISNSARPEGFVGDYVIGAGDLLVISVLDLSEVEKVKVRVEAEGFIRLPLVNTVKAKDLTVRQLESNLANLFGAEYLHNPQVSVFIEEYRSQRVAVLGEVNKPGIYEMSDRPSLTDMLAQAGGLSKEADQVVYILRKKGRVPTDLSNSGSSDELLKLGLDRYILRKNGHAPTDLSSLGSSDELLKIDLDQLLAGVDPSLNITVSSGDVISVRKAGEFLLGGAVKKAGPYPLKAKLTVDQAIYFGDGLKDEADLSNIEVLRFSGSSAEVFKIDLEHLKQEPMPGLIIQKNDVVFVGTSGPKAVLFGAIEVIKQIVRVGVSAGAAF